MKKLLPNLLYLLLFTFSSLALQAQEYNNFEVRYQSNLRGDLTFIGNNILNRDRGSNTANVPYNNLSENNNSNRENGGWFNYNDYKNMRYIDVDGDPTTFSSSSATFNFGLPDCNIIRYAGLYWSGTYPRDFSADPVGTARTRPIDQVKLSLAGGAYVDITADDILFDGLTHPDLVRNAPYACYADVTNLITALADPSGVYTVANIPATQGTGFSPLPGGSAAGWTLVVVYENPSLTGKLISTFDGFAQVNNTTSIDIPYSGFETIPVGPVRASLGSATLEGDFRIDGDGLSLEGTPLSNASNPVNNFFNSNITLNGADLAGRTPSSLNTLGYDTDIFQLDNFANSIISNGQTAATFTFSTNGDQYYPFFNSFNIEVIEANVVLEKKVQDRGGADRTGQGVHLGELLDYVLTFENIGNDDATGQDPSSSDPYLRYFTIRDVLPVNVSIDLTDITVPAGVVYEFDPVANEIRFAIPDALVAEGHPGGQITMGVKVAENCFDFVDACTDEILNVAYSTYRGVTNTALISDDPSVTDFNNCGYVVPGATNFLLDDLANCDFRRTVELCGDDLLLNAGANFDAYIWYADENNDGLIDAGDTLITDGDPDNDPSTLLITEVGTYIVDKQVADPCKGFQEIITVEHIGNTQTNPITALINDPTNTVEGEILICPNDGDELPQIFLCGINDTELIQLNILDDDNIDWQRLDESSCAAAPADCANKNNSCGWNTISTGDNFLADTPGQYRVQINYDDGCFSRFYFNVFQNPLDPQYISQDIICNTPGNITVTNLPANYEYRLLDQATGNIIVDYNANPSFNIPNNGVYRVEIRQQGVVDGCVFEITDIGIQNRDFQVDVDLKNADCHGLGDIAVSVLNVRAQYYYEVSQGGTTVDTFGPTTNNFYTFTNLNPGTYDISTRTDDGCIYTDQVIIADQRDLDVSASLTKNIDCTDGVITVNATGGFPNPNYGYAIWSYNGTNLYADINAIPATAYQSLNDFNFTNGQEGVYEFVVVDGNICSAISNPVTIAIAPSVVYDPLIVTDESCFGATDGSVAINVTNTNGYTLSYELTYPDTTTNTNNSGTFTGLGQGDYTLTITQTQGNVSCNFQENFTIGGPTSTTTATAVLTQEYNCLQDGIIAIQGVSGGLAPYAYSIDGVNFIPDTTPNARVFENLTAGTYTLAVRDANNCITSLNPITIDPLVPPSDLAFSTTPITCPSNTTDLTVTITDGEAPYTLSIVAPLNIGATSITANTAVFTGLAPNTYTFRVTDDKNCTYEEDFTINPITPIQLVAQNNGDVSCFNAADGVAAFTITGFGSSYNYNISGPLTFSGTNETATAFNINSLVAGTYTITVTDTVTNCTATDTVTINGPTSAISITENLVQPSCVADGTISLSANGGWGGYTFAITSGPATYVLPAANTAGVFNNLQLAGNYSYSVTDANGCAVTGNFTINTATIPVLAIVPNNSCYDASVGLTLTANVTSGGSGGFEYSLNGGTYGSSNVFSGLAAGTYTISVRDSNTCIASQSITIDPALTITANASNIAACGGPTAINIIAAGGDTNYVYAVVADGVSPIPTDFSTTNPLSVTTAGAYDVYVRDHNGNTGYCEAVFDINITQDPALAFTANTTPALCSGDASGTVNIVASGGTAPYQYSIDNGVTYQNSANFINLSTGNYTVRVRDNNNCELSQLVQIAEPNTLSASAAVTQLAECNAGRAEVRITNAIGGTAPYEYSFDGGSTYGNNPISLLFPGTHNLYIRDANNCTFLMTVVVAPEPTPPTITPTIDYDCDGEGRVSISASSTDFDYTYQLDGQPNPPSTTNLFTDVSVGSHTLTVNYISNIPPTPSVILLENFGTGANTSIPEIDGNYYCYEPQDGTAVACNPLNSRTTNSANQRINDLEYSVTQVISSPFSSWLSPNDASLMPNGRFLAINVGNPGVNTIVYAKRNIAVIPNQDIEISLAAFNLLRNGRSGLDPDILIELVDASNTVIASGNTGIIPKNNGANDWFRPPSIALNPGANTSIDIVIRTVASGNNGNDIAIDDIQALQIPEVCSTSIDIPIDIQPGFAFDAALVSYTDISCAGANDGSLTFVVENFGAGGFEYSLDNFTTILGSSTATTPITINNLGPANHSLSIRDVDNPIAGCTVLINQTITAPAALTPIATITQELSCIADAIITATATGGTPAYTYQLEDGSGTPVAGYDFATNGNNTTFVGLGADTYTLRVRDTNSCVATTTIVVNPANPIVFDAMPTACYSGANDGSIAVNVTSGNGGYQFRLNGGAWITPSPATATTHTFGNLGAGSYTIEVRDAFGCPTPLTSISRTIEPLLTASVVTTDVSSCADGTITVTASGGDGNYAYAYVLTGTSPSAAFGPSNSFNVPAANAGTYDVYVRDDNGNAGACEFLETVTINPAVALAFSSTPTDPECYDGRGSINWNITAGTSPYTVSLVDLDHAGAANQTLSNVLATTQTFYNLQPGNYTITITDSFGCAVTDTPITINNPAELTATVSGITPTTCTGVASDFGFAFSGYPGSLGTIEFSDDGGTTWIGDNSVPGTSDQFTGYVSGQTVNPSMRTVDGSGNTICQTDLPPFIIPYPLDDLDITILPVIVNCNELQVTVRGQNGTAPYEYTYSDDPANFDPATTTWVGTFALGVTHTFLGLVPGRTYTFYVRDAAGCVRESSVNVNNIISLPLGIDSDITPACDGVNNGSITYTVTDNLAPFGTEFRWTMYNMASGTPTAVAYSGGGATAVNIPYTSPQNITVNNLAPGNYFIEVTEVDGGVDSCVGATENQLLQELDPIIGTPTVLQNISCNNPGLIFVDNLFGGGGNYTFNVSGPAGFTAISATPDNPISIPANSPAGNYDISVQDQYGCSTPLGTVPLTLSANPTITSTVVDNCTTPISLTVNANSTAAQILYSIDGGATYVDNGGTFTNVAPGNYNISIIDSNGCTDAATVTVHPLLEFNASLTTLMDCELAPANNAEITITVTNGSGNYAYEIDGPGATDQALTPLVGASIVWTGASAVGNYDVTVYDTSTAIPHCLGTIPVNVPAPVTPNISLAATPINVSCNGAADGSFIVSSTDVGTGPYTYEIIANSAGIATPILPTSSSSTAANFNGLAGSAAGIIYTVEVTAANGCTAQTTATITQPDPIVVNPITPVAYACTAGNNSNNATITFAGASGGSNNFTRFEFIRDGSVVQDGSNPTFVETDLLGGNYTINVYDDNGCSNFTTTTITAFDALTAATATYNNDLSCTPGTDGSISLTATSTTGDTTRFRYSIDNGASWQIGATFSGLTAGTHNFLIRHIDTGCIISTTTTIPLPAIQQLDLINTTPIVCFGSSTGQVTLNLNDGSGTTYANNISYTLYLDVNNTPTDLSDDVQTNGTSANGDLTINSLAAGTYFIEVVETAFPQCPYQQSFSISGPNAALAASSQLTAVTCALNDGIIEITNTQGGWGGYTYFVAPASAPAPVYPTSYQSSPRFTGLTGGAGAGTTYQIWMADSNGCTLQLPNETLLDPTNIAANLQINNPNCTNIEGEIEVSAPTGGQGSNYNFELFRNGISTGISQTTRVFNNLGAGTYTVLVTDQWGCELRFTNAVSLQDEIVPSIVVAKIIDCTPDPGGHVTVTQNGGSGTFNYSIVFPDGSSPVADILATNTATFTQLTMPGVYTVTVTDTDSNHVCSKTITINLDDKVYPVLLPATTVDISCNGGTDGSIRANLDASTATNPTYQYELIGLAGAPSRPLQNDPLFNNLPAGDYQIRVVSGRACELTQNVNLTAPTILSATATATAFNCAPNNSVNTATISLTALGGTAPYLYSFNGGGFGTTTSFAVTDNGSVQTINYVVRDTNGCEYPDSITINPLNSFSLNSTQNTAISCANGAEEVLLNVIESNPTGHTYTFSVLPLGNPNGTLTANTATSATFQLTAPNTYTFRATNDVTGCYQETTYTIAPYDLIDVSATATAAAACFTDAGSIAINVSGYSGAYAYEVFRTDGTSILTGNGDTATNPLTLADPNGLLVGGNYYVTVTEDPLTGCAASSNSVTIASPSSSLTATAVPAASVSCTNDQGAIVINASGGYPPYDMVLTHTGTLQSYTANNVSSQLFSDLPSGNYSVSITDDGGCNFAPANVQLSLPNPIVTAINASTNLLNCEGDHNASVWADLPTGGSGSYLYQLNTFANLGDTTPTFTTGPQATNTFTDLGAGVYSITVADGWSCDVTTNQVLIAEPTAVAASLVQTVQMSCTVDASLLLTATGGDTSGTYEYYNTNTATWVAFNGGNTHTFSNITAGTYEYTIRDANSCEAFISNQVSVEAVPPLNISIDDSAAVINCSGENTALIIVEANGGLGDYTYELFTDAAFTNRVAGPQTDHIFNGLGAGNYFVRVNSQDCVATAAVNPIIAPDPLQIVTQEVTNISCAGADDGQITLEVTGGTGIIKYAITPNLNKFDTQNVFTDLSPGVYDVIAQDENGCFIPFQFNITAPDPISVTTTNIADEVCAGSEDGMVSIAISGGTAPYRTSLNSTQETDFTLGLLDYNNLPAGNHVIFVRDAQDCEETIIITIEAGVNLNAQVTPIYECSSTLPDNRLNIVLEDPTVANDVMYALDSQDANELQLSADFSNMAPGAHYLTIAHANGCTQTIDFTIAAFDPLSLRLENNNINEITAIAEGGNPGYTFYFEGVDQGTDNTFIIRNTDTYVVSVVDENGCETTAELFLEYIDVEIPNYFTPNNDGLNDFWIPRNLEPHPDVLILIFDRYGRELYKMGYGDLGWNGNYNTSNMPSGDYWYVIKLKGEDDDREFVGHFTLYR